MGCKFIVLLENNIKNLQQKEKNVYIKVYLLALHPQHVVSLFLPLDLMSICAALVQYLLCWDNYEHLCSEFNQMKYPNSFVWLWILKTGDDSFFF